MTYGYGDDAYQGRSANRPDESDEAYQAMSDPRTSRHYSPHSYDSAPAESYPPDPTGRPPAGYPAGGYPPAGSRPSDYPHTEAAGRGAPGGYGAAGEYRSGGYPPGGYGDATHRHTGQRSGYPTNGPYPPQPAGSYPPQAAGSYPPQPAGPYPPQSAHGQTGTHSRTRDDETGYAPRAYPSQPGPRGPQPPGPGPSYGSGTTYPPQQYGGRAPEPAAYRPPQPGGSGIYRAGAPQTGTLPPAAFGQRDYPAPQQRRAEAGDERPRPRGEGHGHVDLDSQAEPEERRSKRGLIITLVVLVLLVGGGFAVKVLLGGGNNSAATSAATVNKPTDEQAKRVASQKVDSKPLTAAEVFGAGTIPSNAQGGGDYHVVKSQEATECKTAVGGDIATALSTAGCTQVVRATITSPDGAYVITAGIFNLSDEAKADAAQSAIRTAIDSHKGRFDGFAAGGGTDVVAQAAANVAWDARGHYLMYCVIALADGKSIRANDPRTAVIVSDVVESYLGGTVVHAREIAGADPSASSSS